MSSTTRPAPAFTPAQKFAATIVLPLLLLVLAATLGSLLGGTTAPAPARADTTIPGIGACITVCTPSTGGGGNVGGPVLPGTGSGGSGGNVAN